MRSDIIRVYKSVHTWTGILSGMALFIAFYAGALTVFKEPLARWASPPPTQVAVPLERAAELVTRVLASRPDAGKEFWVHLRDVEHAPARLSWKVRATGADDHDESGTRHYVAGLDQQGGLLVEEAHPTQLGEFIDVLHRVVGLPVDNDPNRWIMGVIAVLYSLALISGLMVLLPSLVKDFLAFRVGRNLKRMWLDAHNVVGLISLPFHIVMALTAAVFAFHDGIYALQDKLLHEGRLAGAFQRSQGGKEVAPRDPATMLPPAEILARVQALSPGFEPTGLQYQQVRGPRATVRVWGHDAQAVSPRALGGFAAVDPYSGRIISRDYLPGHQDPANLTISSFFALHMAAFGGASVQWMYFLLGLAGAWLFYSGNLLWIETRRRKARREDPGLPVQRRDTRLMASATVGVCIGCICGISLTIVSSKWLHGYVADLNAWHRYAYYAAFFGCIAWAFLRGGARSAAPMLWLAAALTLAIPVTSLAAALFPALGLWAHSSGAGLGVDLTAFVGALCLAWQARATARRVADGPRDSVWSDVEHRRDPRVAGVTAS